jgi:endogenous inhibitor of DNA gyrase (YacG/DUF329 family)
MCGKPPAADVLPFCSRRCAQLDLARWLDGSYAIAGEAAAPAAGKDGRSPDEDESA